MQPKIKRKTKLEIRMDGIDKELKAANLRCFAVICDNGKKVYFKAHGVPSVIFATVSVAAEKMLNNAIQETPNLGSRR